VLDGADEEADDEEEATELFAACDIAT